MHHHQITLFPSSPISRYAFPITPFPLLCLGAPEMLSHSEPITGETPPQTPVFPTHSHIELDVSILRVWEI